MYLQNFIRVYDSIIPTETCNELINIFKKNKNYHEDHNTDFYKFNQLNLNTTPNTEEIAIGFCRKLIPLYEDYFQSLSFREYVEINNFEEVRIKKYVRGSDDCFKTHVDITDLESSARFCIAIAYLNENNGYTTFPKMNIKVDPKPGRVVIFPPNWMFPHNGQSPTDSDKYIMMTSLHYR